MKDETFDQLGDRVMAECTGKGMLLTDVIKIIMMEIAKKLDELHPHPVDDGGPYIPDNGCCYPRSEQKT